MGETNASTPGTKLVEPRQTLAAWAKMVNAAGGINGKKVKILAMDDGNDPAKASANVKTMIDQGVVAIVSPNTSSSLPVWSKIAKDAGIPIIGGGCYDISANADQNFYCVTTNAILDGLNAQVKYAADNGAKVFGITYTTEIPAASAAAGLNKALAPKYGIKFSDAVGASNTAPDYTAICVTMKGSNTTDIGIEGAPPLQNLARDCARQNYFPQYTSGDFQIGTNAWAKSPDVAKSKVIAAVYSFPYMLTKGDTPEQTKSLQQWQAAMKKYAPSVLKSDSKQLATVIWTGGLAFGAALSKVPAGTEVNGKAITDALNTFNGETLGGLAPNPLTFTAGQEHPHNSCWWGEVLQKGKLTAPKGMKTTCTP